MICSLLSFCFILTVMARMTTASCGANWVEYEGNCYGIGHSQVGFAEAAELCELYHARLAEIETSEENAFIKQLLTSNTDITVAWVGATDIFKEGTWEWLSSGQALDGFTDWAPDEPNAKNTDQDCLGMAQRGNFQWYDMKCSNLHHFVCESSPSGDVIIG